MREIVLDTETTGLSPRYGDRIVEIGCVEIDAEGLKVRTFHRYINPERWIHPRATAIHRITNAMVVDKPIFEEIADEFIDFVANSRLIIHNARFDVGFLNAELARVGRPALDDMCLDVVDTLRLARRCFPGLPNGLDDLCRRLGVNRSIRDEQGHGALIDAELLSRIYPYLKGNSKA